MPTIKAKVQSNQNQVVAKKLAIGQFSISMSDIADVDTSGQTDGSMMIFDGTSGKYIMSTQIDNENLSLSGGTY
jgi:hypothetical protein|tara:strand:- start:1310 stop:1531 length:222 start_codon:yes stop_codon:yes gene_type:complete